MQQETGGTMYLHTELSGICWFFFNDCFPHLDFKVNMVGECELIENAKTKQNDNVENVILRIYKDFLCIRH